MFVGVLVVTASANYPINKGHNDDFVQGLKMFDGVSHRSLEDNGLGHKLFAILSLRGFGGDGHQVFDGWPVRTTTPAALFYGVLVSSRSPVGIFLLKCCLGKGFLCGLSSRFGADRYFTRSHPHGLGWCRNEAEYF